MCQVKASFYLLQLADFPPLFLESSSPWGHRMSFSGTPLTSLSSPIFVPHLWASSESLESLSDITATTSHARDWMLVIPCTHLEMDLDGCHFNNIAANRHMVNRCLEFTCWDILLPLLHHEEFTLSLFHPSVWWVSEWLWASAHNVGMHRSGQPLERLSLIPLLLLLQPNHQALSPMSLTHHFLLCLYTLNEKRKDNKTV